MKAAAITLAFSAAPAFALVSARPGDDFRILRREAISGVKCEQAVINAEGECTRDRNGGRLEHDECFLVGHDAGIECLVDLNKVPEANDKVHTHCRAEAVKGSRACLGGDREAEWDSCFFKKEFKAYLDCVTISSQSFAIWDDFCSQAYHDAIAKSAADVESPFQTLYAAQNASLECLVNHSKVPEASDAVHTQCRAEAFKGARDCSKNGETLWETCFNQQFKAYPDCVKKNNVTTTSGQSQNPAVRTCTVPSTSTQSSSSGVAQPSAKVQAPQDPPRDPAQVKEDELCPPSTKAPNELGLNPKAPNKWGLPESVCRRSIAQCVFEELKKIPKVENFDGVIECMDKRAKSTGFDYGFPSD
ncbi:hypothetical protein MHUMG1_10298 [Metarhizium humberi]|uniref:Uncharacterized protein n=1 Tax=Metarhizium humberi TaxID=2596975 RepID=A0A9P8M196_9HYPO|nr:hypothetical protein MHUMG1_10298 [Metarhizium humberi]